MRNQELIPGHSTEQRVLNIFDDAARALHTIATLEEGLDRDRQDNVQVIHDHIAHTALKRYELDDVRKDPTVKASLLKYFTTYRESTFESQWFLHEIEQRQRELDELLVGVPVAVRPKEGVDPAAVFSPTENITESHIPEVLHGQITKTDTILGKLTVAAENNPSELFDVYMYDQPKDSHDIGEVQVELELLGQDS
jgi:hypothetical protein